LSETTLAQPTVAIVPGGPVVGSIRPPGSKSLTNRALVCAAFAGGKSVLTGALRSDDTEVMIAALSAIGIAIDQADAGRTIRVDGVSRQNRETMAAANGITHELFIGNSGTTIRFLTAALSALGGDYRLVGVPRMHQRPIGDLVEALQPVCDGQVDCESPGGCPPVSIRCSGWTQSKLRVAGSVSSQYLSGLMLAAPISGRVCEIAVLGELVSRPYVEMTAQIIRDFGVEVELVDQGEGDLLCRIDGRGGYQSRQYAIEPDASAASYFWAAAAISGGEVTVVGLGPGALQGDVGFVNCLEQMGCRVDRHDDRITVIGPQRLRGIDVDMNAISDTVQTLSVVALFADGPTRVRGVAHNRYKETDRIGDLARELRKLGAVVTETDDGMIIDPAEVAMRSPQDSAHSTSTVVLDTYDDHRMAMSLALAGLRLADVRIRNPACTAKTYPEFFADLEALIGRPHVWRNQ
jgi:3-phosphoshikimate 1-carboxyvinyltransferase